MDVATGADKGKTQKNEIVTANVTVGLKDGPKIEYVKGKMLRHWACQRMKQPFNSDEVC